MILFDRVYNRYSTSVLAYNLVENKIEYMKLFLKTQITHYYRDDEFLMLAYISWKYVKYIEIYDPYKT